ncbi:Uncharacterised protein [Actinomyces bovis]|uniref:Uncharacterized protein n=1 Tax=Actinomyces bovis TaxID=1658 RepID=A0ABY1VR27_9ACTO|nr:hypothetical protein [Actinomyces bovis]SPT54137.1 Uncharacterised protein [Actinomyces bovis]VEG53616.1 Uncharacterised protein [Actinomyces israelii]
MRSLKSLAYTRRALAVALVLGLPLLTSCSSTKPAAAPSATAGSAAAALSSTADATPAAAAGAASNSPTQSVSPTEQNTEAATSPSAAGTSNAGGGTSATVTKGEEVERGPHCTAEDLKQPTSPDELTADTSREQALKEVGKTIPASPHTVVENSFDNTNAYVVKVEAGATTVEVNAAATVVVIEGDIDTLIVNGTASTIWVDNVDHVQMGENSAGNYVMWTGSKPDLQDQGTGNTTARAEYAVHVHNYC